MPRVDRAIGVDNSSPLDVFSAIVRVGGVNIRHKRQFIAIHALLLKELDGNRAAKGLVRSIKALEVCKLSARLKCDAVNQRVEMKAPHKHSSPKESY
jgi:hypothetical protein